MPTKLYGCKLVITNHHHTAKRYVFSSCLRIFHGGIYRFGSNLNGHVPFHVCVVDGVFEAVAGSVIFHPATCIDEASVAQVQATLRRRILRAFVGRGLLESCDAKDMLAYQHSGFSVSANGVATEPPSWWQKGRRSLFDKYTFEQIQ